MSEAEQAAIYLKLTKKAAEIKNEIAAIDADLNQASDDFAALIVDLARCDGTHIDWEHDQGLTSGLPEKVGRHKQLNCDLSDTLDQLSRGFTEPFK